MKFSLLPLLLLAGCVQPSSPPATMPEAERKVADAKMKPRPRPRPLAQTATIPSPMPGTNKFRAIPKPPAQTTNVIVVWTWPAIGRYAAIRGASETNMTFPYTWLEGTTNFRSWYQRTDLMPYATSNGVVLRMIEKENLRAVYGWKGMK